ncbi:hypothetical protein O181_046091 [Austropuccinia psidii MF-1]|uniref:Uncharacterized protein n=1 Tax=Austropuccinia psidii MF-1 TaxID=1389203 RepID=A0A9Q3DTI4_9BASI|nr:hypothetical protein [Austropuccinia psidii MF-1]
MKLQESKVGLMNFYLIANRISQKLTSKTNGTTDESSSGSLFLDNLISESQESECLPLNNIEKGSHLHDSDNGEQGEIKELNNKTFQNTHLNKPSHTSVLQDSRKRLKYANM